LAEEADRSVNGKWRKVLAVLMAMALVVAFVPGCKAEEPTPTPTEKPEVSIKAAMVTDTGGLGDKSFNDLAWAALTKARDELGAEVEAIQSNEVADYEPNIDSLVGADYKLIMTVGVLMGDTTVKKAPEYPDVNFIGIDQFFAEPTANMLGITFREHEGAFMAGVVAAMATTDKALDDRVNDKKIVGFVGGMDIPPVERFEAGFRAGVAYVDPTIKVISTYVGDFNDQAKGKEQALSAISQGADVVFAAAGQTGLGCITACQEAGALFIGVDADQYVTVPGSGDVMLTSSLKYMDVAAFDAIKKTIEGGFPGGQNLEYGLSDGAVGLAPYHDFESKISQAIKDKVAEAEKGILDGTIKVAASRAEL
jgi:basic membrane protein A